GRKQPWGGHRDVHPPGLVEQPLVVGVVDPRDHPRHPVLGLGQQRYDQVHLVVPGRADDHVAPLQAGLVQRGDLGGVGEQPLGPRQAVHLDGPRVLVYEQYLVPVVEQFTRDGTANRASACDGDPHHCAPFCCGLRSCALFSCTRRLVPSRVLSTAWRSSRSCCAAITCRTSPSWSTIPAPGSIASPSRVTNATRAPVASSSACTFSPTHAGS